MNIPPKIKKALEILQKSGYEAYIVGGCVRDLLRNVQPNDWDLTTNAKPEEIQEVFNLAGFKTFYENSFGTVTVINQKSRIKNQKCEEEIEITPFRTETKYSDKRHPDNVKFVDTIDQDLARRDFTINAMAISQELRIRNQELGIKIIDLFGGKKDIENKIIKAVGEPDERFNEDALRMMRAVRFAVCLDEKPWTIEEKTYQAIKKNANLLKEIAKERIKDELTKIIMSKNGAKGIDLLRELELLQHIIPELLEGLGIDQNKHHTYEVYQHNLLSLDYACKKGFSFEVRLASLLHDIAKPRTKNGEGENASFHNHEIVGAKMTKKILENLKFPKKEGEKITKLVRYHLFYYNVDEVGESSVRRLLRNVGQENIEELMQVRQSDRIGSGVPKAEPYKLRHLKYLLEKVAKDPISPKMLKVNGQTIMETLQIKPGPKVGQILSIVLSYVLSDPTKNTSEFLTTEITRLGALSDQELAKLAQKAKTEVEQVETKQDQMTKAKYWVS
ncbi:MAG: HD domain-containing protein [Candidatus Pacebacteria bacterium]|nr:HD domain-containing protein [Candidatus Paceibacterota bacterium]